MVSKANTKTRDKLTTMLAIGVELRETPTDQAIGPCPFCKHRGQDGKRDYFFFNRETGLWDCKHCGKRGNLYNFLTDYMAILSRETHMRDWQRLQHQRGKIPWQEFKRHGMAWTGEQWLIPQQNEKGTVVSLLRWDGSTCRVVPGLTWDMFGMQQMATADRTKTTWITEGWSDFIAWRWYLDKAGRKDENVMGLPSASTFKSIWSARFNGLRTKCMSDNDTAGDEMAERAFKMQRGSAKLMQFVWWPDVRKVGYDTRDFVNENEENGVPAEEGVAALDEITHPTPFRHEKILLTTADAKAGTPDAPKEGLNTSFADVMEVYRRWIEVDDDFEMAAALSIAICMTDNITGDPVWMYIIGPPSSGKTLILMALQGSERIEYQSSMSQHSLVSGWNVQPDPSLLPKFNHKTAVFKDGTSIITMHPEAKKEIYDVLRQAFDGEYLKVFGHLTRHYTDLHFGVLIGITDAIYGESQAIMGDRFLKFYMPQTLASREAKTRSAVDRVGGKFMEEDKMKQELSTVMAKFLTRRLDPNNLIPHPQKYKDRITALALMTAILRGAVEREANDLTVLKYKPTFEIGTRVAVQLSKLGHALVFIYNAAEMNESIYEKVLRVGEDTCTAMNMEIVNVILANGNRGMTTTDIGKVLGYPTGTVTRRANDLKQLGALQIAISEEDQKIIAAGGKSPNNVFKVTNYLLDLWERSRPDKRAKNAAHVLRKPINGNGTGLGLPETGMTALIGRLSTKKLPRVLIEEQTQEIASGEE